jgi:hypothetical protein
LETARHGAGCHPRGGDVDKNSDASWLDLGLFEAVKAIDAFDVLRPAPTTGDSDDSPDQDKEKAKAGQDRYGRLRLMPNFRLRYELPPETLSLVLALNAEPVGTTRKAN